MKKLAPQPQRCNSSVPNITEQDIVRARAALGVKTQVPAAKVNVYEANARGQRRDTDQNALRRARARDYTERAFRAARWGRS
jgi:hypothetical protein